MVVEIGQVRSLELEAAMVKGLQMILADPANAPEGSDDADLDHIVAFKTSPRGRFRGREDLGQGDVAGFIRGEIRPQLLGQMFYGERLGGSERSTRRLRTQRLRARRQPG